MDYYNYKMKTPTDLRLSETERAEKLGMERVKGIEAIISKYINRAVKDGSLKSGGGVIEYDPNGRDEEVQIVVDYLRRWGWQARYNPQSDTA